VRAGIERRELRFDLWQQLPDPFPVQLPGKVDHDTRLLIARAHPQIVGGDRAHLGGHQQRGDLLV
jgi:hypothetical protein